MARRETYPHPIPHRLRLQSFRSDNMTLRAGKTVELLDGDFLRIKSMWQDVWTTEVILCGPLMRRTRELEGLMARKLNETCWIKEVFLDGSSEVDDVPLGSVLRIRQLRMTNRPFKEFNISHTSDKSASIARRESEGVLFCRFQFCSVYVDQAQKKKNNHANFSEKSISSLEPEDVDEGWLAEPPKAPRRGQSQAEDDDLRIISENGTEILVAQPYTFGDVFCGAGGVSCGAKQAGLRIVWGLERDADAARSFVQNFPEAVCEVASVDQFIHFPSAEFHVDIMHISPPCPSFSPMQTIKGKDFEEKQVVILSLNELVKMNRPRVVTMEETFGLLFERNMEFFASVVRSLNDFGYSVRWKILNLGHYGAPQPRRRLIVIAAGPGELLPPFPTPTHLDDPNTIHRLISDLPPPTTTTSIADDPLHSPKPFPTPRAPYNAHGPLRDLIACSPSPANYHPDGHRPFTIREFACLQTFPREYRFAGSNTAILRQIGNAVPPTAAKTIFQEIIQTLKKTDEGI